MAAGKQIKNIPATEQDFHALEQLRGLLDQQSEEALGAERAYISGVLTELLVQVDEKLVRASRFSRRTINADKRKRVRALRKAQAEGTTPTRKGKPEGTNPTRKPQAEGANPL